MRTDTQIQKIIDALESESYALAQNLIQEYIDTPIQEVHQRVQNENQRRTYTQREQELIDQFDLFISDDYDEEPNEVIDINQYLQTSAVSSKDKPEVDYDKLLEIDKSEPQESIERYVPKEESISPETDTQQVHESGPTTETISEITSEDSFVQEEKTVSTVEDESPVEEMIDNTVTLQEQEIETVTVPEKTLKPSKDQELSNDTLNPLDSNTKYRPIFSIKQQFLDASQKYPFIVNSTQPYNSVTSWIGQIGHDLGYTKSDVEKTVIKAAELILLSGLTEDEFGQLILAREFFKGRLFEKNVDEAFKRIEQLANREYPEAICDLAQFYEHGVGTKKNKKRAKELYEKAMHFGIQRAKRHFGRLTKEGGMFSF